MNARKLLTRAIKDHDKPNDRADERWAKITNRSAIQSFYKLTRLDLRAAFITTIFWKQNFFKMPSSNKAQP